MLATGIWGELTALGAAGPPEMAFHSAVVAGHYMVLHGGYVHLHGKYEKCYEREVFLYNLRCHRWQVIKNI